MKKWIVLSCICVTGIIACGKKIVPGSDAGNGSDKTKNNTANTESNNGTQNNSATSTPSFNNMEQSIPAPYDGPRAVSMDKGKTVYVTKCKGCHGLKNPGDYTSDQLTSILSVEIPKANLSSQEAEQVTAYLLANSKK